MGLFVFAAAGARSALGLAATRGNPGYSRGSGGLLRGGVEVFRGVPFAQSPIGDLRFRPPQPMSPWTGVRDATHFAAAAVQPGKKTVAHSEDCLYLNVWVPEKPSRNSAQKGGLPVFVWIHGGGFTGGYAFDPLANGERFARDGVVCITVAYRLGSLGFLDVSPLLGPSYAGSADNALWDLIAALQWIQQNVHALAATPAASPSVASLISAVLQRLALSRSMSHKFILAIDTGEHSLAPRRTQKQESWKPTATKMATKHSRRIQLRTLAATGPLATAHWLLGGCFYDRVAAVFF